MVFTWPRHLGGPETLFWHWVYGAYSEKGLDCSLIKAITEQLPQRDRVGKFLPDRCLLIIRGAKECRQARREQHQKVFVGQRRKRCFRLHSGEKPLWLSEKPHHSRTLTRANHSVGIVEQERVRSPEAQRRFARSVDRLFHPTKRHRM